MEQVVLTSIYNTLSRNLLIEQSLLIDIVGEATCCPKDDIVKILEKEIVDGRIYEPKAGMLSKVR